MKLDILLELIFTTYWSQILLLIGGIGYLIKIKLDRKTKKIEIRSKIFYENKIKHFNIYTNSTIKILNKISSTQYDTIENYILNDENKIHLKQIKHQEQLLNFSNKKEGICVENIGEYFNQYDDQKHLLAKNTTNFTQFENELNKLNHKLIEEVRSELENLKHEIHNDFIKD